MTQIEFEEQKDIMDKLFKQAVKNGFDTFQWYKKVGVVSVEAFVFKLERLNDLIFNHEFMSKAIGDEWKDIPGLEGLRGNFPYYQMVLTQLVMYKTDKERIEYLGSLVQSAETPDLKSVQ